MSTSNLKAIFFSNDCWDMYDQSSLNTLSLNIKKISNNKKFSDNKSKLYLSVPEPINYKDNDGNDIKLLFYNKNNNFITEAIDTTDHIGNITRVFFKVKDGVIKKVTQQIEIKKKKSSNTSILTKEQRISKRKARLIKFGKAKNMNNNDLTIKDDINVDIVHPSKNKDNDSIIDISLKLIKNLDKNKIHTSQKFIKYIPPNFKNNTSYQNNKKKIDKSCIRLSNITKNATENDIFYLCNFFGKTKKTFLVKDKEKNLSLGYAFVTYYSDSDAKYALDTLNGHPYDNLILKTDYAFLRY